MVNCGRNVANGTWIVAKIRQFPNVSGDLGGSVEKKNKKKLGGGVAEWQEWCDILYSARETFFWF
jgi:hypothetical protein